MWVILLEAALALAMLLFIVWWTMGSAARRSSGTHEAAPAELPRPEAPDRGPHDGEPTRAGPPGAAPPGRAPSERPPS
jgi:hypothetical protein